MLTSAGVTHLFHKCALKVALLHTSVITLDFMSAHSPPSSGTNNRATIKVPYLPHSVCLTSLHEYTTGVPILKQYILIILKINRILIHFKFVTGLSVILTLNMLLIEYGVF